MSHFGAAAASVAAAAAAARGPQLEVKVTPVQGRTQRFVFFFFMQKGATYTDKVHETTSTTVRPRGVFKVPQQQQQQKN